MPQKSNLLSNHENCRRHRGELVAWVLKALNRALGDEPHEWIAKGEHEDIVKGLSLMITLAAGQLDRQEQKGGI